MALTPLDIKNKSFSTKMRGFAMDEVDDFLEQIISDYEDALRSKKELEKALKHADEKLTYFNELKDALNQSIIVAQDTADKLKDSAARESELVVNTAEADARNVIEKANAVAEKTVQEATQRANDILNEATTKATKLASETDDLKKKTRDFHRNLVLSLESQLEMVKSSEWDDLIKPFASYVEDEHVAVKEVLHQELDKENEPKVESEGRTQAIELAKSESSSKRKKDKSFSEVTTKVVLPDLDE